MNQLLCIFIRIIHTMYKTVLKAHSPAGFFEIFVTGCEYFFDIIFICNRHQFSSFFLIGTVK